MDHTRREDEGQLLHVTREVPLWSIVSGLALVLGQAIGLYVNQMNLTTTIAVQADSIHTLSNQYAKMSADVSALGFTGLKNQMKLEEFDRRIQLIEADRSARGKP